MVFVTIFFVPVASLKEKLCSWPYEEVLVLKDDGSSLQLSALCVGKVAVLSRDDGHM